VIALSIRRPVAVAMGCLAVALLGASAWRNIPVELLPDTRPPRLEVRATWPGTSPETVEAFLTSPLESVVQQVRGVSRVTSTSTEGSAVVDVEFNLGTEMNFARLDLQERIAALEDRLPAGVEDVRVAQWIPTEFQDQAQAAILQYRVTGPFTLEALRTFVDDRVIPEIAQVEGVALVRAEGGRRRLLEVELDRDRVESLGLTAAAVAARIGELDLVREAGVIRGDGREWALTIRNPGVSAEDLRRAVLLHGGGQIVRVSDVARVRDTFEELRSAFRMDGLPVVSFSVVRGAGENTIRVADAVKARILQVEPRLPAGVRLLSIDARDQSLEIKRQLTDLRSRALVSAGVIFLVLLLALRSFRSAGVVFATIALAILISINLVHLSGLSLNLLTLMGLALGFGLVVDNSIVVLENVHRRWREGFAPFDAAYRGSREVVLPILASTVTTLIVFIPFVYLQGELRIWYVPLAIVVALTLMASLIVAFSFIPAITPRLLPVRPEAEDGAMTDLAPAPPSRAAPPLGPGARLLDRTVALSLRFPRVGVLLVVLALGASGYLFERDVPRGELWGGSGGPRTYVSIQIALPRGSDLERTDELARWFEEKLAAIPAVASFETSVTGERAGLLVYFPEELEATGLPEAIKDQLYAFSLGFTGVDIRVYGFGPSFYGGGSSAPNYSIGVQGYNFERVRDIAANLGERLRSMTRVEEVDTNATGAFVRERATEFVLVLDRVALGRYGIPVQEFVARVNGALRGRTGSNTLLVEGEETRFEVKLAGFRELDVAGLRQTVLTTGSGARIRVEDVARVEERGVLSRIVREDQQYTRVVAYEFRGPRRLGDRIHEAVIASTQVPPGYTVEARDAPGFAEEDRRQMARLLAVALLLVFMVTAALFESLRQPLVVLLTVPMALIGVFLTFRWTGATFTREAYIGVIMMGGIVVNNAILLVDHINRVRREAGEGPVGSGEDAGAPSPRIPAARERLEGAIRRATRERARPILMTTATTVLGLAPLVLLSRGGTNGTIWNALAYTLMGGLVASTALVLTVTPALYLLFESRAAGPDPVGGGGSTPRLAVAATPAGD
jgi:hydrophobic/amphiphilic exporter-1 (mainly G- bacteria), HAE1 family